MRGNKYGKIYLFSDRRVDILYCDLLEVEIVLVFEIAGRRK
jgi:hypothetical protein